MKQVIFHIGLAKASSTFLQRALFEKHSELNVSRELNKYPNALIDELLREICALDQLDYYKNSVEKKYKNVLELHKNNKIVMSYEHLSSSGRADRAIIAHRLRELSSNAKILIIIRSQYKLIESSYAEHIKASHLYKEYPDINRWLEDPLKFSRHIACGYSHPMHNLNFYKLISKYNDIFNTENVCILPLEELKTDRVKFYTKLCNFLDIDLDEALRLTDLKGINIRRSRKEAILIRLTKSIGIDNQKMPQNIKNGLKRIINNLKLIPEPSYELNDKWKEKIRETCGVGNRKISKIYNLPLEAYGYPYN